MEKSKNVFTVSIQGTDVFKSDNDVQAVVFALSLHQSANLPHEIVVRCQEDEICTLVML